MNPGPRVTALVLGLFMAALAIAAFFPASAAFKETFYHPYLEMEVQNGVEIAFLFNARTSKAGCERHLANVTGNMLSVCPACKAKAAECPVSLNSTQQRMRSADPLDVPSARLPDGVATYRAIDAGIALAICRESDKQSLSRGEANRVVCFGPNIPRPLPARPSSLDGGYVLVGLLFIVLSALASGFACYLIVRYEHLHAHFTHDHVESGPQKFHASPVPRIGGVAILLGLLVAGIGLLSLRRDFAREEFGYLLLAALPVFAGGIAEDITKKVGVLTRLLLTMMAAALGAWLMSAVLERVDVPGIDSLLAWTPLALALTIVAVSGVANSINLIDGYNGLAGGFSVLVLAALATVAVQVGDVLVMIASLALMGALLSFLVWNYPKGKLFLGDSGAYLVGFWLAELSVVLVVRHPEVSPWFPLLLLAYPVFETLFSMYRRKFFRGHSPGRPDALHLHQLIYFRLVRVSVGSRDSISRTHRNGIVAGYIWAIAGLFCVLPALLFWRESVWLAGCTLVFCTCYVWLYRRMIGWRAPGFLIRRLPAP